MDKLPEDMNLNELYCEVARIEAQLIPLNRQIRILTRIQSDQLKDSDTAARGELRDLIEHALHIVASNGASSNEICEFIQTQTRHNIRIRPNSVRVLLNRLKRKGLAKYVDRRWFPAVPAANG